MASSSKAHQASQELPRNIACAISLRARQMEQPAALLLVPYSRGLMAFRRRGPGQIKVTVARWRESEGRCSVETGPAMHLTLDDDSAAAGADKGLVDCLDSWVGPRNRPGPAVYKVLLNCGTLDTLLTGELESSVLTFPDSHSQLFPCCIPTRHWSAGDHILWAQRIAMRC